nr:hypothetical protein Iba_chr08cCG10690 [Ipomoea batatas]
MPPPPEELGLSLALLVELFADGESGGGTGLGGWEELLGGTDDAGRGGGAFVGSDSGDGGEPLGGLGSRDGGEFLGGLDGEGGVGVELLGRSAVGGRGEFSEGLDDGDGRVGVTGDFGGGEAPVFGGSTRGGGGLDDGLVAGGGGELTGGLDVGGGGDGKLGEGGGELTGGSGDVGGAIGGGDTEIGGGDVTLTTEGGCGGKEGGVPPLALG